MKTIDKGLTVVASSSGVAVDVTFGEFGIRTSAQSVRPTDRSTAWTSESVGTVLAKVTFEMVLRFKYTRIWEALGLTYAAAD